MGKRSVEGIIARCAAIAGLIASFGLFGLTGCSDGAPMMPGPGLGASGGTGGAGCAEIDCFDDDDNSDDDDDDSDDKDESGEDDETGREESGPDEGSTSGGDTLPDEGGDEGFPTSGVDSEGEGDEGTTGDPFDWGSTGDWWPDPETTGEDDDPLPTDDEACFLGSNGNGNTCFPVVTIDPYSYPNPPLNINYREPIRYLDVDNLDGETFIAPNFRLREMCVPHKGRYQVAQPHAIEKLQQTRNQAGPLTIKSGFRSPPYNAMQPGAATNSRHMFGDAFDLVPSSVTQQQLYDICESLDAGYIATYTSGHVHCDWRNVAVDSLFYGSPAPEQDDGPIFGIEDLVTEVEQSGPVFAVTAGGFDESEGELTRAWVAYDEDGAVLATSIDRDFVAPPGTDLITVNVGGMRTLEIEP